MPEDPAPDGAPESVAPPTEPPPAPAPPSEHPESVPWDDHVALRHENARYKQRYHPIEQAFAGFDDDTRSAMLEFAGMWSKDPEQAFAMLAQLRGYEIDAGAPAPDVVTREEWEAWQAQQHDAQESAQLEAEAQAIAAEAQALGVDPSSPAYASLLGAYELALDVAQARYESGETPDFEPPTLKAVYDQQIAQLEGFAQQVRDGMVAEKRPGPSPTSNTGTAPSETEPITDFEQAKKAAEAFLASQ